MGQLLLEGYAGKVKYAQLLNDASEVKIIKKEGAWMAEEESSSSSTLRIGLPIRKPDVEIPVIELFLN